MSRIRRRRRGSRLSATGRDRLRLWLLVGAVAVIGHEAALGVGHGPAARLSSGLRSADHGLEWLLPALAVLLAAASAAFVAVWQLRALTSRLRGLRASAPAPRPTSYVAKIGQLWPRLFALGIGTFLVQENAEHLIGHGHFVALGPLLEGQYAFSIPVFAMVALLVAASAALLGTRLTELREAVAAAAASLPRAPRRLTLRRVNPRDLRREVRRWARPVVGRAPPLPA